AASDGKSSLTLDRPAIPPRPTQAAQKAGLEVGWPKPAHWQPVPARPRFRPTGPSLRLRQAEIARCPGNVLRRHGSGLPIPPAQPAAAYLERPATTPARRP